MASAEGSGTSHYYFPEGEFYTIPYRALIPSGVSNMLVAGRCISSDHGAQASYRIMPTVCCIGEAAGSAIAIANKTKSTVREVNTDTLRATLKANGAFVDAFDALSLAKEAGSQKAVNIALMGRLAKYLNIPYEKWINAIKNTVAPKFVEINEKAFSLGYNA